MNFSSLFKIALKALQINKMRAFLTMLGIIIGVASVIAMLAIGEGSKESIKSQISSMGSNMITIRPGAGMQGGVRMDVSSMQTLTVKDLESIEKKATLVENTSPVVNGSGQAIRSSKNWPTTLYGVAPDYLKVRVLDVEDGTMFTQEDIQASAKVAVIGKTIVENLFGANENPIGATIRFNKIPFKIIGVLAEKGENTFGQDQDDVILAPYTAVQKRVLAATYLQSIVTSSKSEDNATAAVNKISQILRDNHKLGNADDDFNVFSQQELISMFSSTSEMMTVLLVAIAGISLLIGGIGIMNIMYVSVKERTREIGLRMAVGGRGNNILMQFLTEAIIISITGGIIGVTLGLISTFFIANVLNWPTSVTLFSILISFAVCAITGIFFGWYPARKAAALDPINALRYE
ncbi:multidrug ABC transporter substrate-binding protein [Flavobacteriaceae bacterium CRH]|nr:multidrug ABC transporter substrate-binding protein [Flavobacteriaceae bacterium CRH]